MRYSIESLKRHIQGPGSLIPYYLETRGKIPELARPPWHERGELQTSSAQAGPKV